MDTPKLASVVMAASVIAWALARSATGEPAEPPTPAALLDISQPFADMAAVDQVSSPDAVTDAIQARFDYLNAHHLNGGVYLPAGHWRIDRPIFMNGDYKELVGAGLGQTFLEAADGYRAMPMINVGARTVVEGRPLQACNRVKLTEAGSRVLDDSIVADKFGIRTYGEFPDDHFPAVAHREAPRDAKAWASGAVYKTNDVAALSLNAAPGPVLAFCVADHTASKSDEPLKGEQWKRFWVIQVPAHIQFVGNALAAGAFDPAANRATDWQGMDRLTLDIAFTLNAPATTYANERILCGAVGGQPSRSGNGGWRLTLHPNGDLTIDFALDDNSNKSIRVASGCSPVGTYRLAAQLDLRSAVVQAWFTRPSQPQAERTCDERKMLKPGAHLRQLEYGYFIVAGGGDESATNSNGREIPPLDMTLCGLHTSADARYADAATLLRLDTHQPPDDHFRYFTGDAGTMAYLPLTDPPASSAMDTRALLVTVQHGKAAGDAGQKGFGYLKPPMQIYGIAAPRISDMTIVPGPTWGVGVVTWHTLALQLSRLDIRGGYYAVGDLFYGAQYPIDVRDCLLSASEAAFNGSSNIVYMSGVKIDPVGRYGILVSGSNMTLNGVDFGDPRPHHADYYFRHISSADYGGMNLLENMTMTAPPDSIYPSKAAFSQDTIGNARTSLVMRNATAANMGEGAAFVELPRNEATCPAKILLEHCSYAGRPIAAWVRTQSPWWSGQVRDFDSHDPVGRLVDVLPSVYPEWKSASGYHKGQRVTAMSQAWEATVDHSAEPGGNGPGSSAGWIRLASTISFEPRPPR